MIQPSGKILVEGFHYDIWKTLEERLNMTTNITKLSKDKPWGSMLESVMKKEYDISMNGNSLTQSRSHKVDFSFPLILSTLRLMYINRSSAKESLAGWNLYLKSFLNESWIAIGSMTLALSIIYSSFLCLTRMVRIEVKTLCLHHSMY